MAALFISGIIIAIRIWGTRIWSLVAGTIAAYLSDILPAKFDRFIITGNNEQVD